MQKIRIRKIIQYVFISALFLFKTSIASSQTEGHDIVELKNGTILQGTIIEQRPGQFLKLWQQPSNDTLTLQYSDIAVLRIVPSEKIEELPNEVAPIKKFNQNKFSTLFFYSINGGSWPNNGIGAAVVRRFGERIHAGVGFHYYGSTKTNAYNSFTIPLEFKYVLQSQFKERISFMFSASFGYNRSLRLTTYAGNILIYISDGVYFNPSVGYRINFSKNTGIIFDLGYQYIGGKVRRASNDEFLQNNHLSNASIKATIFF